MCRILVIRHRFRAPQVAMELLLGVSTVPLGGLRSLRDKQIAPNVNLNVRASKMDDVERPAFRAQHLIKLLIIVSKKYAVGIAREMVLAKINAGMLDDHAVYLAVG